jgi:hypothetical protein
LNRRLFLLAAIPQKLWSWAGGVLVRRPGRRQFSVDDSALEFEVDPEARTQVQISPGDVALEEITVKGRGVLADASNPKPLDSIPDLGA